jgi:hypothetical protein
MAQQVSADSFTVKQVANNPGPGGNYNFEIYDGRTPVARLWHDYRGDEYGIVFPDGSKEDWPVGGSSNAFLEGGGPQPLRLSAAAVAYLRTKIRPRT